MVKLSDKEIDRETDRQLEAWYANYGNEPEPSHAEAVEFDCLSSDHRLMTLKMSDGHDVVLPLDNIQGLAFVSPTQLHEFEILGRGTGMDWPSLGVSFSVQELIEGSYGNRLWMQALKRRRSADRPERKQTASPANGIKSSKPCKAKPSTA